MAAKAASRAVPRIVIVGGGLTGLALADRLQQRGADWRLLEARDRLGGRILSQQVGTGGFDLGPTWFAPGQPRMAALASRLQLQVFRQYATGDVVFEERDGSVVRGGGYAPMAGSRRVAGGLTRLVDALAERLPAQRIRLDTRVQALTDTGASLRIDYGGPEPIDADQLVLALPPRLLASSVAFTPPLPAAVRDALIAIPTWMAGQAKIVAVYDAPFWRAAGLSGDAMSRHGPLVQIHDASGPEGPAALFGFVGLAPQDRVDRDGVLEAARQQLGRLFGAPALNPREMLFKDWAHDPLTATPDDHAPLTQHPAYGPAIPGGAIWDDRVWVSGTETAPRSGGYLEGALEAAENIAERLAATSAVAAI